LQLVAVGCNWLQLVAVGCSWLQSVLFYYTNASPKKSAKLNGRNTWLQLVAKVQFLNSKIAHVQLFSQYLGRRAKHLKILLATSH
jgi:hypothetical protein